MMLLKKAEIVCFFRRRLRANHGQQRLLLFGRPALKFGDKGKQQGKIVEGSLLRWTQPRRINPQKFGQCNAGGGTHRVWVAAEGFRDVTLDSEAEPARGERVPCATGP